MDEVRLVVSVTPDGQSTVQDDSRIFGLSDEQLFGLEQAVKTLKMRMKQTQFFRNLKRDLLLRKPSYNEGRVANCGLKRYQVAKIVQKFHQAHPNTAVPVNVKAFVTGSLQLSDWEKVTQLESAREGAFWSWASHKFASVNPPPCAWANKLRRAINDVDCVGQAPILQLRTDLEKAMTEGTWCRQQLEAPYNAPSPAVLSPEPEELTSAISLAVGPTGRSNKRRRTEASVDGQQGGTEHHTVARNTPMSAPAGPPSSQELTCNTLTVRRCNHKFTLPDPVKSNPTDGIHSPAPATNEYARRGGSPPTVHPDQLSSQASSSPGQVRTRGSGQQDHTSNWSQSFLPPRAPPDAAVRGPMNPTLPSTSFAAHNVRTGISEAIAQQQTSDLVANAVWGAGMASQLYSSVQMRQSPLGEGLRSGVFASERQSKAYLD
ncbi:hypothetical protein B0J12DRAFT_730871 [Macrophomina phaseolina]|uniref:Uncharacterized protein n=1 Tax=Macrophomina phaseolina TaxID=35725 RepID=A0ABQ8G1X6_9PEZI|nr:hypothetical protein B0J12DRAFT_730871 [Macrophomina phaseolina]